MVASEPINLAAMRQVQLFRTLDEAQLHKLSRLLKERRYRKGEIIFHQDDPGGYLHIISSGRVRIYLAGPDGREVTLRIYGPGSNFGELSVLDGESRTASAAALEAVTTYVLYRADFLNLLRENFALVEHIIALLVERVRYTTNYSEQLAFLSAPGRVAALLVRLAGAEAEVREPIRLELSQQELADFANTTREWVNRALHDFAAEGLVRVERRAVVILDPNGLLARMT
jgi:CRP/FNR family transcriptional regulator, cyclic AMP receptor protein